MKSLFLLFLLLTTLSSVVQDKFIEVEVSDTITLQPKNFEYNILIGDSPQDEEWNENYSFDQKAYEKKIEKNKNQVEKLLQSKKYNYKASTSNTLYPPLGAPNLTGFSVTLTNRKELENLLEHLQRFDFVNGSIDVVQYKDEEKTEGFLLKKLIDKAKSKAALIAAYSDLRLGKIIEVTEGKEPESLSLNIHDTYLVTESKAFLKKLSQVVFIKY